MGMRRYWLPLRKDGGRQPFFRFCCPQTSMKKSILGGLCLFIVWTALPARAHPFTGMVSFGDSLSDMGNTVATLSVFGEPFVRETTGYNANFYFNGRFSDAQLWSERLHSQLGFGPMLRNDGVSVLDGSNFSWAAARSGTGNSFGIIPNLQPQVQSYTAQLATNNPALPAPSSTLFTLWIGGNDVFAHVENNDPITPAQVAANVSTAISNLYDAGGRSFLVPNLPPIGLSPDYLNDPIKGPQATAFANAYNAQLDLSLNALSGQLTGIDIIKLDINQLFLDVIADPAAYGLVNVTQRAYTPFSGTNPPFPYGSVVGNPDQYLYWDSAHGTRTANILIGETAFAAVPEPSTFALLLCSAVAGLYFARKHRRNP